MNSGNPDPANDLFMILETKRNSSLDACHIVSGASAWMKAQLKGAKIGFQYGACQTENQSTFSSFTIHRSTDKQKLSFELKIAEINKVPFAFIDVHPVGKPTERLFPFFGEIGSEKGKSLVLNYIADFLISSETGS